MKLTLGYKQEVFTYCLGSLIEWMHDQHSYDSRLKEVLRTKEQAEYYHSQGKGILNSNHRNGLAADIYWTKYGELLWDGNAYQLAANHWKTFSEAYEGLEFCWGGDFKRRDVYHYSIRHRGVM